MDAKQEFYDKLFEEPTTIKGLRNKYSWLRFQLYDTAFEHSNFELIRNEIKETTHILKLIPFTLKERRSMN